MSVLLKSIRGGEKRWQHEGAMSVNEQLPESTSFVSLTDLTEREWVQYLENFQTLLCPAFANRKSGTWSEA
ncbi:hypothetical protein RCOM_0791550 [Ricinus communis]|uniref:Uncharacterized protein n=1 Tax=Ricinus communis TaxID=3988 RepID=B9SIY2_RICCO|nr:hypothetical protein RCOM_0791550 [Ricinus communis]